jgi:glycosyltransferase involved in cell wall biosynthesis
MVICLRLRLRGERFDVVYVPSSEIVPALIAGIFAKFMFSCRLVVCNTNIEFYAPCARRILAWLHNVSDQVITLSNDLTQSLRRNGVKAPIALNAVGLDLDMISKSLSNVEGRKNYEAVFVGRHDQGKGIFDLVQAWSIVTGRLPQATLITIGIMTPEYAAKLERLIAELGMEHRVVLSGVLDEKTKFRLIRESKVCLFPSYLEGWGIVPQEALACGLPVVLYDLPVYRENIRPCESVFTVPIGDVRALAEKALELLSDDRYEKYKEVGPEFVQRFRWAEIAGVEFDILVGGAPRAKVTRTSA